MIFNWVATISGGKGHLSSDSVKTLCGRDVSNAGADFDPCKRCTTKRDKIVMQENTDRFIAESDARLAADRERTESNARTAETQDDVMSQAEPVVEGKWDAVLRTTSRAGFGTLRADDAMSQADAPVERESYEIYARWAVGPVMTREEYQAKGDKIQSDAAAGTLSTNPYEWGVDMDAVQANLHTVEPAASTPERVPTDVRATDSTGHRITYAYIPNGDPVRVALFVAEAESFGTFTDVAAIPTPDATEREREQTAQCIEGHPRGGCGRCDSASDPWYDRDRPTVATTIHYGESVALCGTRDIGVAVCEGGDGPCPNACQCGCDRGAYECECEALTTDLHSVTCHACSAAAYCPVDDPERVITTAVNGHVMAYETDGLDGDGRPRLVQHSAVHSVTCPCLTREDF